MAGGIQAIGLNARLIAEIIATRFDRHDDLFECRVAGPLADAVDRALNLASASFDGRQTVGDAQSQIVVTMRTEDCPPDVRHVRRQMLQGGAILKPPGVTDRNRDFGWRKPWFNRPFDDLAQEIEF